MASLNKVLLIGNLTRDIEMRYVPSGAGVAQTGLAMNRKFKDKQTGEIREDVTFVDLEIWGKQAETAQKFLSKGKPVFIEGSLKLNQWETEGGEKRSKITVRVQAFQFLPDGKGGGQNGQAAAARPAQASAQRPRQSAPASGPSDDMPPEDLDIQEENIPF